MANQTFKEIDTNSKIVKRIKKYGISLGIIFSKEDIKKFNLEYDTEVDLSNAEIIKTKNI